MVGTMVLFNWILLCYDATPAGRRALHCGAALAQRLQAETHLLSILFATELMMPKISVNTFLPVAIATGHGDVSGQAVFWRRSVPFRISRAAR